jgi:hypothetical protein
MWQQQHLPAESPFGFGFWSGVDESKNRQWVRPLQSLLQAVREQEQEQHQRAVRLREVIHKIITKETDALVHRMGAARLHEMIHKIIAQETDALGGRMVSHEKQDEIEVKKSPCQTNTASSTQASARRLS